MQDIVLDIPFNRDHFLSNQKTAWSLSVKSVATGYIIYSVLTVLVLIAGISVDWGKGGFPLISLLGLVMLVSVLLKLRTLYQVRKRYFAKAKYIAKKSTEMQLVNHYIFSDFGLTYEDDERFTRYKWSLFDSVMTYKDRLILRLIEDGQIYLMLSREEIGSETYDQIHELLVTKTGVYDAGEIVK